MAQMSFRPYKDNFLPKKEHLSTMLYTGLDKQTFKRKIVNIFLPISFNICCGYSKEPSRFWVSHRDGSFEYPQHMF